MSVVAVAGFLPTVTVVRERHRVGTGAPGGRIWMSRARSSSAPHSPVEIRRGISIALSIRSMPARPVRTRPAVPGIESIEGRRAPRRRTPAQRRPRILHIAPRAVAESIALPRTRCESLSRRSSRRPGDLKFGNRDGSRYGKPTIIATRDAFGLPARWAR